MKKQLLNLLLLSTIVFSSCGESVISEKSDKENKETPKTEIEKNAPEKEEIVEVEQPKITSEEIGIGEKKKPFNILGKRMLSLQWIKSDKMGVVEIKDMGGAIMVRGKHLSTEHPGDYLKIEGSLISASETELVMDATIKTKVYHLNNGKECVKEGRFTFLVTKGRKYWRNQDMNNACEEVTDYVDIYFE